MLHPDDLFLLGSSLSSDYISHRYVYNALNQGLSNYRILSCDKLVESESVLQSLPNSVLRFIVSSKRVLLIANQIEESSVYLILRSLEEKKFMIYGENYYLFYGFGSLIPSFKRNDPIIVVEGVLDRDVLIEFYPYVLATLGSGMSIVQRRIMKALTNKVILFYDKDDAGIGAFYRDEKELKKEGVNVYRLKPYAKYKDPGCLVDLRLMCEEFERDNYESYLRTILSSLM